MSYEQVIQKVIFKNKLDALIKLLRNLVSPTLQLTPQSALAGQRICGIFRNKALL